MRIGLFTPDRAFDMVSKAQIAKLREPSIKLVDLVTTEMMNMCKDASAKVNLPKKKELLKISACATSLSKNSWT